LLIQAQVLHWQDDKPVEIERKKVAVPYQGYLINGIQGLGYETWGYADPRLNRLYVEEIQAELRQCMDRIRPNSSAFQKYIYIATEFPCADHVDDFQSWQETYMRIIANNELEQCRVQAKAEPEIVKAIMQQADCVENTAKKYLQDELEHGVSYVDGKAWADLLNVLPAPKGTHIVAPKGAPLEVLGKTQLELVVDWLRANPTKALSINKAMDAYHEDYPARTMPARSVFQRAIKAWKQCGRDDLIYQLLQYLSNNDRLLKIRRTQE
jgi:hypothetical protein